MREVIVYVGLGSNEGDRETHLRTALERLDRTPGITVGPVSGFLENELVGDGPPQGAFLNAVAELRTTLLPHALLGVMKALETAAGRTLPAKKNHPRALDLDLLGYGQEGHEGRAEIDTVDLRVPHPEWHRRAFVTGPLAELGIDTSAWSRLERPRLVEHAADLVRQCGTWLRGNCVTGLVPTMGALHDGHRSLMERARAECDRVLVTIFVNPLQFGAGEDLAAYPRPLAQDLELCREAGVDAVFAPAAADMYAPEFCSHIAVGRAADAMEGAVRPGHFGGVATVVAKLFALCRPDRAYFGEKDAQQLAVIRRMTADLCFPVEIRGCPIVRESDGLARSSRNIYLGTADRAASTVLYRALSAAREAFARGEGDRDALVAVALAVLQGESRATVDYLELRRDGDFEPLPAGPVTGGRMLVAARFDGGVRPVRLIDNMALDPNRESDGGAMGGVS